MFNLKMVVTAVGENQSKINKDSCNIIYIPSNLKQLENKSIFSKHVGICNSS